MNCTEARPLIEDLAAGRLNGRPAGPTSAAQRHAEGCPVCSRELIELTATVSLLRRAGTPPLPAGFEQELHERLLAAGPSDPAIRDRFRWASRTHPGALVAAASAVAAALAAVLAIAGTTAVLRQGDRSAVGTPARFRVPQQKVILIKVDFASEKDIGHVNFEILLPDGLRFYAGGRELAERSFQWQGKLSAGANVVPIAVKGARPGRYHVMAHATGRALDVAQDVILEVTT